MSGSREAGQAIVEMALTFLIFIVLIFAIIDGARLAFSYNTVSNAAREGTRYAIVHGSQSTSPIGPGVNESSLTDHVKKYVSSFAASDVTVVPNWPSSSNGPGSKVKVKVDYTFHFAAASLIGINTVKLSSVNTMVIVN